MFSPGVMEHVLNPSHAGELPGATHTGVAGEPGDGPYIRIWLQVAGGRIAKASYETYGCPAAIACGSMVARLAHGRTLTEMGRIEPADLVLLLGGLPEGKEHCPRLAVAALRRAIGSAGSAEQETEHAV